MAKDWRRIVKARRMGCKMPVRAWNAHVVTGVPYWVICAYLEQETDGGMNVFGQDASIYRSAGYVTKDKYLGYRALRHRTGLVQGVGPMQLTYGGYQDMADKSGGCWNPQVNITTGARILNSFKTPSNDWRDVALRYNGASWYVDQIGPVLDKWRNAFT